MLVYLGCVLVASGLAVIALWRSRWAIPIAVVGAGVGIFSIIKTSRETPPPFTEDDAGYLCRELSSQLDDRVFEIVFAHPRAPRIVSPETGARHALMVEIFDAVAPVCVQTPATCKRILAAADPTSADFQWHVNYVASIMRRHERCEEPVPSPPPNYLPNALKD